MARRLQSTVLYLLVTGLSCVAQTSKARAYFDELYKAGGLDRRADSYVCFDEDPENQNFFIFARSETLKAFLVERNGFDSLPAASKALMNKGFLSVRGYNKGIPLGDEQDQYVKEGESWVSDPFRLDKVTTGRMRLRISFETLRYRRSVETTKDHQTHEAATRFGKCEAISPAVPQKGE